LTRAIADASIFIAQEADRELGDVPDQIAVSVITAAELEHPLLPVDAEVASCFARIASAELFRGRRPRRHDTWIAATALRHNAAVVTQDAGFSTFDDATVIRV
jgi:predicted nucleic acid-binding protein